MMVFFYWAKVTQCRFPPLDVAVLAPPSGCTAGSQRPAAQRWGSAAPKGPLPPLRAILATSPPFKLEANGANPIKLDPPSDTLNSSTSSSPDFHHFPRFTTPPHPLTLSRGSLKEGGCLCEAKDAGKSVVRGGGGRWLRYNWLPAHWRGGGTVSHTQALLRALSHTHTHAHKNTHTHARTLSLCSLGAVGTFKLSPISSTLL